MKSFVATGFLFLAGVLLPACGASGESPRPPAPALPVKEALYRRGHEMYAREEYDSAIVFLEKSLALDSLYEPAVTDMAVLFYEMGMREGGGNDPRGKEHLRRSEGFYARLERSGENDPAIYERLCELSAQLADTGAFVRYAQRYASRYPSDRQYHNLGIAYYEAGRFQDVIRSMKEAIGRFPASAYTSSFYRQLGYAYMKVDRDQTAERTFYAGLAAIEDAAARAEEPAGPETLRRTRDDTIAILRALRRLHRIYGPADKLQNVERQLRDAGYRE